MFTSRELAALSITILGLLVVLNSAYVESSYFFDYGNSDNNGLELRPTTKTANENPIVFVPGDGGCQLEAKLNKTTRVHYICDLVSDWYDIWLNIHLLAPMAFDCLCENLKLTYNVSTRTTHNTPGVQIRPRDFGNLDTVDYLDLYRIPGTNYFTKIISTLESRNGYTRNVDMVGAGFDFRKAPNELEVYFKNLTRLIEEHYANNNNRPVTLICHSMGCLNSFHLLNSQTKLWKSIYVKRLISLAAPWFGSFKAITAMLHGDNLGIPLLNKNKLQALQSTFPSLMYLFPREPIFDVNRVLIRTNHTNYTLENLDKMFEDTGLLNQREIWHDTRDITMKLTPPDVELWCLYGSGVSTPSLLSYPESIDSNNFVEFENDGDGTVNSESLQACKEFQKQQSAPVYAKEFPGIDHIGILRRSEPADYISAQILKEDLIEEIN